MRLLSCSLYILFSIFSLTLVAQSGYPDSTFGIAGIARTDGGPFDLLAAIAIQSDQKILAAGTSNSTGDADYYVSRYLPDGSPDPDFGESGSIHIDLIGTSDRPHAIYVQKDGSILLAGQTTQNNKEDFSMVKVKTDGTLDKDFGDDGMVIHDLGSAYEFANAIAIQEDGKIVLAGRIESKTFSDFAVTRYLANGEIDADFGVNGVVITSLQSEDEIKAVAIQPGGKILVAGFSSVLAKGDFALVRYLEDGTIDDSFGDNGKVLTDLAGNGGSDFINGMLLDPDGNIVVAGSANFDNLFIESDMGMVRYDPDGHPDNSFDGDGIYILDLGNNTQIQSIARQTDGKYLVAGKTDYVFGHNQWMLARLMHNGGLDTSFGDQGISLIDLDGDNESAYSMVVQNDSRIVVGGINGAFTNLDFVLARFIADFVMEATIESEVLCHDGSEGSISVNISAGGVPPYFYSLDGINFQASPVFNNLPAGEYTVIVKDSDTPATTSSIGPTVLADAPAPPEVQILVIGNNVSLLADGPGVYLYSVNGGVFVTNNQFLNLLDGFHHFAVKDENGCIIFETDINIDVTAVQDPLAASLSLYPNPCNELLTLTVDVKNGFIPASIVDATGRFVSHHTLQTDVEGRSTIEVSNLPNGIYFIKMQIQNQDIRKVFVVAR